MTRTVKPIPMLDLMSFLLETPDTPMHVGSLQLYRPVNGRRSTIVKRMLRGFRDAEVAPPFNYIPHFKDFSLPQWAEVKTLDKDYHVRSATIEAPGTREQLIDFVMKLNVELMDRKHPGWIVWVIDGLENDEIAVYMKLHHAYIDGPSANMRFEAGAARSATDLRVRPIWSPLLPENPKKATSFATRLGESLNKSVSASGGVLRLFARNLLQASGRLELDSPVPFSAPPSIFNAPVQAVRRLGVKSLPLSRFREASRGAGVSINDVALALVGEALERYAATRHERLARPLVAVCPMSIRAPGDTEANTQFAAISVRLGEPGVAMDERLKQVNRSATDAKNEARSVPKASLVSYLALLGVAADTIGKSPLADYVPPLTNVNVSNVAGPTFPIYLAGAELVAGYPVSTLAGGTAINITFTSSSGRMDYAVITDAKVIPEPQFIADAIAGALDELEGEVPAPGKRGRPRKTARAATKSATSGKTADTGAKRGRPRKQ